MDAMECDGMQWNKMWWNVMECDGMWWNGRESNAMKWNVMEWSVIECNGMRWNEMEWNVIECNGRWWNVMECNGIKCDGMRWNAMQWNVMECDGMWYEGDHIQDPPKGIYIYICIYTRGYLILWHPLPTQQTSTYFIYAACSAVGIQGSIGQNSLYTDEFLYQS